MLDILLGTLCVHSTITYLSSLSLHVYKLQVTVFVLIFPVLLCFKSILLVFDVLFFSVSLVLPLFKQMMVNHGPYTKN